MENWCGCGRVFEAPRKRVYCEDCLKLFRNATRLRWAQDRKFRQGQKKKRLRIMTRDHWTCQICLLPIPRDAVLGMHLYGNVDHIVPRADGGEGHDDNYQATHSICNSMKSDQDDGAFKAAMRPILRDIVGSIDGLPEVAVVRTLPVVTI